jgi:signal transduction histidine kinase
MSTLLKSITHIFSPPIIEGDENKTLIARILNVVLWIILATIVAAFSLVALGRVHVTNQTFFNISAVIGPFSIISFLVALRKGHVRFVAWSLVSFQWFSTVVQVIGSNGIESPALGAFIVTILLAGFLVSRRGAVVFGVLSVLSIMGIWYMESNNLIPEPLMFTELPAKFLMLLSVIAVATILLYMVMRTLQTALDRSHQYALELEQVVQQKNQAETAVRQSAERLEILHKISHAITELRDLESVLEIILQQVLQVIPLDTLFITLYDPETQSISFPLFYEGGKRWDEPNSELKPGSNISRVIQTGKSILRLVTAKELEYSQKHPQVLLGDRSQVSASFMYVPLLNKSKVIGVISAQSYALNVYTETNLRLLEGVALQAAIAIENARLYANLQNELAERLRIEAERELLIKKLEANNAELERFTYTVSHDLRSPLVTIKGFLGMLAKDIADQHHDRVEKDMGRIASATDKMDALLSDLLELSRIGRIVNPPEEIDLVQLAQDAAENVEALLRDKNITLTIAPDLPTVPGDKVRLREVFQNLIENAAKYTGDQRSPMIEIGSRPQGEKEAVIFVKDNGLGIDPQYHARIFNLFEKLNPTVEGTGIGLALVKRIIEVHGGKIWVESEGVGKGSVFYFTIRNGK